MDHLVAFIAGWGAGMLSMIVGHPMDTIKTKQQMSLLRRLSVRESTKLIIAESGVLGLYKGMLFPLLSSGTLNSAFFGVYAVFLSVFQRERGNNAHKIIPTNSGFYLDNYIAGSIGGLAQAFISCPSELIKIRIQTGKGIFKYKTLPDKSKKRSVSAYLTTKNVYQKYGISGLFIGFVPTLWRDIISNGIYIVTYQYFRYNLHGQLDLNPGSFEILIAGGIAGVASWVPVIPLDTVKSRLQADEFRNRQYKGMMDCGASLYKNEGLYGFFKGSTMITLRAFPVNAAMFYGYNMIMWIIVPHIHH